MKLTADHFDEDFNKLRNLIRTIVMERAPPEKKPMAELAMTEMVDPVLHIAMRFVLALEGIEQNTRGGIK